MEVLPIPELAYELAGEQQPSPAEAYGHYLAADNTHGRLAARNRLASAAVAAYAAHDSLQAFGADMSEQLAEIVGDEASRLLAQPFSTISDEIRDRLSSADYAPCDALWATAKNLEVARSYARAAGEAADGVLLSGSSAWGAFFAPRGIGEKPSDADVMIKVADLPHMEQTIGRLASADLLGSWDEERAQVFSELYAEGRADMFSARSHATGTEVSMHFLTERVLSEMRTQQHSKVAPTREGVSVPVITDFRPNTSSNVRQYDGYQLHLINRPEKLAFFPNNLPVENKDAALGYLADAPIGGQIAAGNRSTYVMGVVTFFLTVCPVLVGDRGGSLRADISHLQAAIAQQNHGTQELNIPRFDRMPGFAQNYVRRTLTQAASMHEAA